MLQSQYDRSAPDSKIRNDEIESHIKKISQEFREGFRFLEKYPKSVTIFGSSLAQPSNPTYQKAEELASLIVQDLNYAVITGGGAGIMEAANKGAHEAGGYSAGFNIVLPNEPNSNGYANDSLTFTYFFSRKAMLTFASEAYIFFPGGFGTCDELFSVLTLIQTGKIPSVPIVLYDSKFWDPFVSFIEKTMCQGYRTIDHKDTKLFKIMDSLPKIVDVIRQAPVSEWWKQLN